MEGHGHSCNCGQAHQNLTEELGNLYTLYLKIDKFNIQCLNETVEGSGKCVFKPWDKRLDFTEFVESDADETLLFNIPFTGNVKLKGVVVIGENGESHPSSMKLFKNRPNMTFEDTAIECDQSFVLHPDTTGQIEYLTKVARFNQVQHLSLYFPENFGADRTRIYFIGLRGDFSECRRQEVVIAAYEARANPADHKTDILNSVPHEIQ